MVSGLLSLSTTPQVLPLALRHGDPCKECPAFGGIAARTLPNHPFWHESRTAGPRCPFRSTRRRRVGHKYSRMPQPLSMGVARSAIHPSVSSSDVPCDHAAPFPSEEQEII